MSTMTAPDRSEAAEYYFRYIDQVPTGDIGKFLEAQAGDAPGPERAQQAVLNP